MTYAIKQSSTEAALLFFMVQSSDHITGLTGASPTVTLSKNGAAFASPSGAVSEIANGWYKVAGNATDTNTLGPLALHATAASGDPCDILVANIVAYDPQVGTNLGLSALPTANPGAANGVLIAGSNAATTISALTLTGAAASGSTPATAGLTVTGGAASTTGGGVAAAAIIATGGAGAASTNGAAAGITSTAGGTTTVSGNDGVIWTGTGNGNGMTLAKAGTGKDFYAQTTNALQVNATAINAVSTGSVTTINTNIGTTQAINFTGSGASALVQSDVTDWKAATAPAMTGDAYARLGAPAGASVSADIAALKADLDAGVVIASPPGIRKNHALAKFEFLMTDSTNHNPVTGLTVSVTRSIDGGAFAAGTLSAVTEIANGIYSVDFGAGDLNGTVVTLRCTAATADDLFVTIHTDP